jgi:hypothetical protein
LVDILLSNGVEFPRIDEEFSEVCGSSVTVKRHWMRDLAKVSGDERRSLLEMAFDAPEELRSILETLQEKQLLPDLSRCCTGQTSLMLAAAKSGRWDIAKTFLSEVGSGMLSVASLLNSPALVVAPRACQELIHLHGACALRASTLKQYFERMVGGESMNDDVLPISWTREEEGACVLKRGETAVFPKCMWLGGTSLEPSSRLLFVRLSRHENAADSESEHADKDLVAAAELFSSSDDRSFRINMSQDSNGHPRRAFLDLPQETEAPGLWLALVCSASWTRTDNAGRLHLHVPMNSVPYPVIPRVNVGIVVKTPCCERKLKGVLVHVNGKPAGTTDGDGCLKIELPLGQHKLSAPYQSSESKVIHVGKKTVDVEMFISGAFYLFLEDVGEKTAVKATTNRYKVLKACNLRPFVGEAKLCGEIYHEQVKRNRTAMDQAFAEVLRVEHGTTCGLQLPLHVKPHPSCGTHYKPSRDPDHFFQECRKDGECAVQMLFNEQLPMTLGYLTPTAQSPFTACAPLELPASTVADAPIDFLNVRRVSRSSGRATGGSVVNARRSAPAAARGRSASAGRIPKALRPGEIGTLRR